MYQHVRLYITRGFVGLLIVLLLISGSKWETESPMVSAVLFLAGCVLVGVASLGRLWCSLYVAGYKTKHLVTVGPYSVCRNPLYFFSMVGGLGVGLVTETFTIPAMILVAFALYYPFVIRFEENKLKTLYGEEFKTYFQTVPRFWPKWSLLSEPNEYVVTPKTFRKHIFSALWFIWMIGILELIEMFRELNLLSTSFSIY
ncbi:MAG: isoprenylcysteine carboxylmethyltransferase family protein [Phycisphaerae bacterium]|nr:isoprenylcysteine carboxylmethyltransferase family protein [Phycisphaerae bacterium]